MVIDRSLYHGEQVPMRYDLLCQLEGGVPVFSLIVQQKLLAELPMGAPLFGDYRKAFGLPEFVKEERALGFGAAFGLVEMGKDFSTWRAEVPSEAIPRGGSEDRASYALACTLACLTFAFEYPEICHPAPVAQQQLATWIVCCRAQMMDGFPLGLTLSPTVRRWVEANRAQAAETALAAMIAVWERMWPSYLGEERGFLRYGFRVWAHSGGEGLVLDVPGNACGLFVDGMDLDRGPGWDLSCHNMDNEVQQLALIAGVASIVRLVRESLAGGEEQSDESDR